jgi:hypothetical protein
MINDLDDDNKDKCSVYEPLELERSQLTNNMNISQRKSFTSVNNLDLSTNKKDEFYPSVYKEQVINLFDGMNCYRRNSDNTLMNNFPQFKLNLMQSNKNLVKKVSTVDILTKEALEKKELERNSSKKTISSLSSAKRSMASEKKKY